MQQVKGVIACWKSQSAAINTRGDPRQAGAVIDASPVIAARGPRPGRAALLRSGMPTSASPASPLLIRCQPARGH